MTLNRIATLLSLAAVIASGLLQDDSVETTISTSTLSFSFANDDNSLTSLKTLGENSREFLSYSNSTIDIFSLTLVFPGSGAIIASSETTTYESKSSQYDEDNNVLTLSFVNPANVPFDLTLDYKIAVVEDAFSLSMQYSYDSSAYRLGIYDATLRVPLGAVGSDDEIFYPKGYGRVASSLSEGSRWTGSYPSAQASMQFFGFGDGVGNSLYYSSHDRLGMDKALGYDTGNSTTSSNGAFTITHTRPNATIALSSSGEIFDFPFVVAALPPASPAKPLWLLASEFYKANFALDAPWVVKAGKISERISEEYANAHVWINSGWQCHDVFDPTQGDPSVVRGRVTALMELWKSLGLVVDQSVALHWYEWQQGPDPTEEGRYKFDTHYPDYFPARVNQTDSFSSVTRLLYTDYNVLTFPYINGRCVDMASNTYVGENGDLYATKGISSIALEGEYNISVHVENYGNGIDFAVMNPQSVWWQDKTASIVDQLVNNEGVNGVYIDQIGAAPIQLCFDPEHGHDLANGNWWVAGYEKMLEKVHYLGNNAPIVTEDNAEVYMNQVEGYLTIVPFFDALVGADAMTPAFASVYGGYFIGFGEEWYASDFEDKDWFRAKLAKELVYGVSLGWFGLGGQEDPDCGSMRLVELFMDDANVDLNQWIVILVNARAQFSDFFLKGSVVGGLVISGGNKVIDEKFEKIASSCWKINDDGSESIIVSCFFVNCVDEEEEEEGVNTLSLQFDLEAFGGFDGDVQIDRVDADGTITRLGMASTTDNEVYSLNLVVDRDMPTSVLFSSA